MMKANPIVRYSVLIVACTAAIPCAPRLLAAGEEAADPVIARGTGFEVHRHELNAAFAILDSRGSRGSRPLPEPRETIEAKLLDHIIETRILLSKSTSAEQATATEAAEKIYSQTLQRHGGEAHFREWLQTMSMTPEQYRRRIYEQETCHLVINRELQPDIRVTEADIESHYKDNATIFDCPEQVRMLQIFLSNFDPRTQADVSPEKKQEKSKLARSLKAQLDAGGDFSKLALEYSDDPTKDATESDAPSYARASLPPEVAAIAFEIGMNRISDVIESSLGFHIIKVLEKQPATRLPLAEVSDRLKELLVKEEMNRLMPGFIERIRREAAVEVIGTTPAAVSKSESSPP